MRCWVPGDGIRSGLFCSLFIIMYWPARRQWTRAEGLGFYEVLGMGRAGGIGALGLKRPLPLMGQPG